MYIYMELGLQLVFYIFGRNDKMSNVDEIKP